MARFSYSCESCGAVFRLTPQEFDDTTDGTGVLRCDACAEAAKPKRIRDRKGEYNLARDQGCIVTWVDEHRNVSVEARTGQTLETLKEIADWLPDGAIIQSISTPRTILRDIKKAPRRHGGISHGWKSVDQYAAERALLSKIGRLDLLPDSAYQSDRVA